MRCGHQCGAQAGGEHCTALRRLVVSLQSGPAYELTEPGLAAAFAQFGQVQCRAVRQSAVQCSAVQTISAVQRRWSPAASAPAATGWAPPAPSPSGIWPPPRPPPTHWCCTTALQYTAPQVRVAGCTVHAFPPWETLGEEPVPHQVPVRCTWSPGWCTTSCSLYPCTRLVHWQ
jgi:hypothetical protein